MDSCATRAPRPASPGQRRRAGCGHASVLACLGEADPVLTGIDLQEGDLAEVERQHTVLRLDVVPATLLDLLAQLLQLVVVEPSRDHLAALETNLHLLRFSHQCPPPTGSTI